MNSIEDIAEFAGMTRSSDIRGLPRKIMTDKAAAGDVVAIEASRAVKAS